MNISQRTQFGLGVVSFDRFAKDAILFGGTATYNRETNVATYTGPAPGARGLPMPPEMAAPTDPHLPPRRTLRRVLAMS